MGLKAMLMEATAKMAELTFDKKLSVIKDEASKQGFQVTFEGEYRQAPVGQPKTQIRVPFVIAQDEGQIAKLAEGTLEGRVYDMGRYATIHGRIDAQSVRFGKVYEQSSLKNPDQVRQGIEVIQSVLQAVGEPSTVRYDKDSPLLNPHVIVYEGASLTEDNVYAGKWHFKSDNADMEPEGPFMLEIIYPPAIKLFFRHSDSPQ